MEVIKSGLQSSLLVRHAETKELFVNFDPQILTLIREAECMARLNLDVPAAAVDLRTRQHTLKESYNAMLVSVSAWKIRVVYPCKFKVFLTFSITFQKDLAVRLQPAIIR